MIHDLLSCVIANDFEWPSEVSFSYVEKQHGCLWS